MTANQIAYQKAQAEIEERKAATEAQKMENEMQELANRSTKFFEYGVQDPNHPLSSTAYLNNIHRRGMQGAKDVFGLLGSASGLGGQSKVERPVIKVNLRKAS